MRRLSLLTLLILLASPAWATTYHLAPASSGGSDSNNGASTSSPWLTPNHSVNCGDVIMAAAGAYSPFGSFGTVSGCGAGSAESVAWLQCATPFACSITGSSGNDITLNKSNWGVQGFLLSGNSSTYCIQSFNNGGAVIHHIIIANNICNGGGAGFQAVFNVDYWVVVGNIVHNAAQGSGSCNSGISPYELKDFDTLPGTHIYIAGNFTWANVEPSTCAGTKPTDGEGIIVDTLDGSQGGGSDYDQQVAVANNLVLANGGRGLEVFNNSAGSTHAHIFFNHNTVWGNGTDSNQQYTPCGEIQFGNAFNITETADLAVTNKSACLYSGSNNFYPVLMENGNSSNSISGNWFYSPFSLNSFLSSSTGFSFSTNTFSNPSLASPSAPGAPSCSGSTTTAACMAPVIANFKPTNPAAVAYGYQVPQISSVSDPLFPQWLCNANLPSGVVTLGCASSSSAPAPPTNISVTQ